ncbi:MAG: aldo/keto reductase [Bacteroidetes bacterium]|nr:aldo/keto reductase [Bacteroidota bacterium]
MNLASKLVLGTVQFGLDYGINNSVGKLNQKSVNEVLKYASDSGIRLLDTAQAYGDSEDKIGSYHQSGNKSFQCITKVPHGVDHTQIRKALELSAEKLGGQLYGVLIHHIQAFREQPKLLNELHRAQQDGLFTKVGFSVYHVDDLNLLFDNKVDFQLVQFPFNVFDQRFREIMPELHARGVEIHTRSAFLQGLFFKPIEQLHKQFNSVADKIAKVQNLARLNHIPLSNVLLGYCLLEEHIDAVVIGVDSIGNLADNLTVLNYIESIRSLKSLLNELIVHDQNVILPTNWNLK